MLTGKTLIDGQDLYTTYGVYIVADSYKNLIAMPPLQEPDKNDWHEEDGIEVDLSHPVLKAKEVQLNFASLEINKFNDLINLLADKSYHIFEFLDIQRSFRLRLVGSTKNNACNELGLFSLKFMDDFPFYNFTFEKPVADAYITNYKLDGKDFSEYSIKILEGSKKELIKVPGIKENLIIKSKYAEGLVYDDDKSAFKSKEIKINCLLRTDNINELWQNYTALLHDLIQPNERTIYSKELNHTFRCYYKNCKVKAFAPDGENWLEFTLTFVITGNLRINKS